MITIVNFSHPVQEGRPDIAKVCGCAPSEYKVIQISVQVDQAAPMKEQCYNLAAGAVEQAGGNARNIDSIILPGLSMAAVLMVDYFAQCHDYMPNILRLAPVVGATPPRFEAVELVRLGR